ncbi:hypothetical protein CEUSTIGMA_g4151.t1 [Chlamydomonas eustigma]|uniref:Uncharacterized protein n=1 Tax=Chlamydomonas eustigma TaxID=1157962 RepID=A0A250X0X8_9CHLO|nr:hypothetical protein CEUSTIGMA_g4151.t1 [Chlamydomonas eustigma]|eukprot:GAX76705.1 hypothetical protein CEUSTIGMA_g4151.t1 [Chlamydomonas eustigma]
MSFVFVCVQKGVEFDITDQRLHRANKDKELHNELSNLWSEDHHVEQYLYQLGGGCRACTTAADAHVSSHGEAVAAFQGNLNNTEDLARMFPSVPLSTAAASPGLLLVQEDSIKPSDRDRKSGGPALKHQSDICATGNLNPAELICVMYSKVGVKVLGLLQGEFSFCLYEAKTDKEFEAGCIRNPYTVRPPYNGGQSVCMR